MSTGAGKSLLVGRSGVSAAECLRILPRNETESGSAYAYRVLSYNILMLYVTPGAWIREASIAEELDLSRTPVHEAMIMLRDRGMVEVAPQSASHVSRIDISALRQCFFLRAAVEPLVIMKMADAVPPSQLIALDKLVDEMDATILRPHTEAEFLAQNNRFHERLYEAANKTYVWETIKKSSSHFDRMINMGILFGYIAPSTATCRLIMDYLLNRGERDPQLMQRRVRESLSIYSSYYDRITRDFPTYFLQEGIKPHAATTNSMHYEPY
jgi:DNA-binding GntR family transcriptional regulator